MKHWEGKGRGLARAGGSLREDVLAGEEEGNGLALDGRRLLVAQLHERRHELLVEIQRAEAVVRACLRCGGRGLGLGFGLRGLLVLRALISHTGTWSAIRRKTGPMRAAPSVITVNW